MSSRPGGNRRPGWPAGAAAAGIRPPAVPDAAIELLDFFASEEHGQWTVEDLHTIPPQPLDTGAGAGRPRRRGLGVADLPPDHGSLVTSGTGALAVCTFLQRWNDFLVPLLCMPGGDYRPLTLGLYLFIGGRSVDIGPLAAGTLITILPVIVLFVVL